jgi:hypothetical protein
LVAPVVEDLEHLQLPLVVLVEMAPMEPMDLVVVEVVPVHLQEHRPREQVQVVQVEMDV